MDAGAFRLFDLADELIVHIVEQLDGDLPSLCSLARSCHKLQLLAEPLIYRRPFIRAKSDVETLLHAFLSHKHRAAYVHRLEARCKYGEYRNESECFPDLINLLGKTANVKDVLVESPLCNHGTYRRSKDWDYAAFHTGLFGLYHLPDSSTFQSLRKFELHLNGADGKRFWKVDASSNWIFQHPTLQELTISCAKLSSSSVVGLQYTPKSPLKTLRLIECNISQEALLRILSIPSALQILYLGENCFHQPYQANRKYNTLCTRNTPAFFAAIAQQRDSLEEFSYSTPELDGLEGPPGVGCGFSGFRSLRSISLESARCPKFEEALWGSSHPVDSMALTHLRISSVMDEVSAPEWFDGEDSKAFAPWLQSIASTFPKLKELQFVATPHPRLDITDKRKTNIVSVEAAFQKRGLLFELYEKAMFTGFIPPYLHGERPPKDKLLYASDGRGFQMSNAEDTLGRLMVDTPPFANDEVLEQFDFDSFLNDAQPLPGQDEEPALAMLADIYATHQNH